MKRFFALTLIVGYLALVPYCFLSASMVMPSGATEISSSMPDMQGMPSTHDAHHSGVPEACCVSYGGGVTEMLSHHSGMYLSLTGDTGTQFLVVLMLLALTALFASVLLTVKSLLFVTSLIYQRRGERRELRSISRHNFLSWISLAEASPTFA